MTWTITPQQKYVLDDPDAAGYIAAVEAADAQSLEIEVQVAIHTFVKGCKADGIWSAIKASCILAGARTLNGALVPLVGAAPTNNNFVSGDYNRKTGLVGNGTNKYINTKRRNNSDPQDSVHHAVFTASGVALTTYTGPISGNIGIDQGGTQLASGGARNRNVNIDASFPESNGVATFIGTNRDNASSFKWRSGGITYTATRTSQTPNNSEMAVFGMPSNNIYSTARLSFYSIGESLDLALLDARVTTLINALAAAIP